MSLEDLDPDLLSDDEVWENFSDGEDDEPSYGQLVRLHGDLTRVDHIYANNMALDTQQAEDETSSNFDSESWDSELALFHAYLEGVSEDMSLPLNVIPPPDDDESGSDDDDAMQLILDLYERLMDFASSPDLSAASEGQGEMANEDDTNN